MDPSNVLLTDKVAIITGGGDGIGKGIALTYAKFGAHVVIADLNAAAGEAVAEQVRALGRKGVSIATDIRNPRSGQSDGGPRDFANWAVSISWSTTPAARAQRNSWRWTKRAGGDRSSLTWWPCSVAPMKRSKR